MLKEIITYAFAKIMENVRKIPHRYQACNNQKKEWIICCQNQTIIQQNRFLKICYQKKINKQSF